MMREPEKLAFEDRVLAYLDGALDDASSERLLSEIAEDPAKQEIFAAHQELDKLIMTARVPLETPEETRRSIAAVIPGLTTYLPEFITTGTGVGLVASRWRAILEFFTQTPLRTALTIGGAAAVVTTGVIVSNNLSGSASHTVANTTVSSSTREVRPSSVASETAPQYAPLASSEEASDASSLSGTAAVKHHAVLSSTTSQAVRGSGQSAENYSHGATDAASVSTMNGQGSDGAMTNGQSEANDGSTFGNFATVPPAAMQYDARPLPVSRQDIITPSYPAPRIYTSPLGLTLTASSGVRLLQRPRIDGEAQPMDISMPQVVSLHYGLSDAVSLVAEGGNETFVRIRESGSLVKSYGALQHFRVLTTVVPDNAYWTRLGAEYQFGDATALLVPFVSGTAGVAFADKLAPMAGVTAGAKYHLTESLQLIGSVGYEQAWFARERENFTIPESAVVDVNDLIGNTVTNSALNISLGISTTF